MRGNWTWCGVWVACFWLGVGCGDDTQISGLPGDDVAQDLQVATDAVSEVAEDADVAADVPADVTAPLGGQCAACETSAECEAAFDCTTILGGSFCLNRCATATECSAKFTCDTTDAKDPQSHCVPPNFACAGCLATGCSGGKVCDPVTGACVTGKDPCTPCQKASDCGPGLKCAALASPDYTTQKLCMPECTSTGGCSSGGTCQKTEAGMVCGFTGLACCYGKDCAPEPACATCPGHCILGQCVACVKDSECKEGHCDTVSHACVNAAGCPKEKPFKLANGTCGMCGQDSDCVSKNGFFELACDVTTTGLCYDKNGFCDGKAALCNTAKGCTCVDKGAGAMAKCSCGF